MSGMNHPSLEVVARAIIDNSDDMDWFTGLELAEAALKALPAAPDRGQKFLDAIAGGVLVISGGTVSFTASIESAAIVFNHLSGVPEEMVLTHGDEASRHLDHPARSILHRLIFNSLRDYRMSNMSDEDGFVGYPLVDLMSNAAPADISTGEMEMIALTDEIAEAITSGADELAAENARLRMALHDAICRPMGVVPASADDFYDAAEGERAMNRGPTLRTKPILTPISPPGW